MRESMASRVLAQALFDYESTFANELSIKQYQVVQVSLFNLFFAFFIEDIIICKCLDSLWVEWGLGVRQVSHGEWKQFVGNITSQLFALYRRG